MADVKTQEWFANFAFILFLILILLFFGDGVW
ncbi:hypothetical protein Tfer_2201 [Thermincola ferriacetica]|uniref:Uncharacterized protein n=2 Tax=Thermincola TaxID=278993 RepID=D5XB85_THEPJ|nr:hypothetical protein TherJR_0524 [Thermincola potens JR]KNZ69097.1 hypothetical protein Tfer_2201 [Thermincola ferriacetica]